MTVNLERPEKVAWVSVQMNHHMFCLMNGQS